MGFAAGKLGARNHRSLAKRFFIADETAFPLWQTPHGLFATGGTDADKELLTVSAPADFRVLAPGKPLKPQSDGSEIARRFLINPDVDSRTYVVAGRYQEKSVRTREGMAVQFWTYRPIDESAAQIAAAARLSASMKTLEEFFGPASAKKTSVSIAEAPVELPPELRSSGEPGGASFPFGALLDPQAFRLGIANESVLELAEYELARTWFGWRVRPRPEAQILMGRGTGLFGLVIAAEGRGGNERARMIATLIDRYDESRAAAPDKRLMEPPVGYSRAERISTGYRGALLSWPWKIFAGMTICARPFAISFMIAQEATPATKNCGQPWKRSQARTWQGCSARGSFGPGFQTIFAPDTRKRRARCPKTSNACGL